MKSKQTFKIVDLDQRKVPNKVVRVGELALGSNNETHRTKYPLWLLPIVTLYTVRIHCQFAELNNSTDTATGIQAASEHLLSYRGCDTAPYLA